MNIIIDKELSIALADAYHDCIESQDCHANSYCVGQAELLKGNTVRYVLGYVIQTDGRPSRHCFLKINGQYCDPTYRLISGDVASYTVCFFCDLDNHFDRHEMWDYWYQGFKPPGKWISI